MTGYRLKFSLAGPFRDLLKHSAVYGSGQVLSRLGSILLLPVYIRYLSPTDYGIFAILDLTVGVLSIVIGSGMGAALNRYHFTASNDPERDQVWWTGLTFVMLVSTVTLTLIWLNSGVLARLTLGQSVNGGEFFYRLILPTLWFGIIGQLPDVYLRVRKWSGVSVGINLVRLLLNIGLNLYFLIILKLGIVGILLGNLITGGIMTIVFMVVLANCLGTYAFHWPLIPKLLSFGSPMIITGLLSIILHQADRYFISVFLKLDQVGIYSFAYTIGQAVNTLILLPFAAIWNVVAYEIADRSDAKHVYAQVFEYFVYGLLLFMLGVSLFARQVLSLFVPPNYLAAADLIPVVCLAYFFFSLHEHFKVPVMLAKKTSILLPVFAIAVLINIAMNLVSIPVFGIAGAAWASVVSFAAFSFVGLWSYRRVDKYDYPIIKCCVVLVAMIATYIGYEKLTGSQLGYIESGLATLIWLIWAMFLFGPLLRRIVVDERKKMIKEQGTITVGRS